MKNIIYMDRIFMLFSKIIQFKNKGREEREGKIIPRRDQILEPCSFET